MSGVLARPGVRLKQLLLVLGAAYVGIVALTMAVVVAVVPDDLGAEAGPRLQG